MAIIAKNSSEGKDIYLVTAGLHRGVCCDVHDLGVMETGYGLKEKVLVVWEVDEDHPVFGGPCRVNKRYTNSLHEKANLSQDLESWRGKSYGDKERKEGIDLEKLIGKPCMLNIVHNSTDKGTWANVRAVFPMQKGIEPLKVSADYVRIKDKPENQDQKKAPEPVEVEEDYTFEPDDDGLPF